MSDDEMYEVVTNQNFQTANGGAEFEEMYEAVEQKLSSLQREAFGTAGPVPIWYWKNRDRKDVEVSLTGQPDGTYVIGDSTSSNQDFVLSVSEQNKTIHYSVQHAGKGAFVLNDKTFADLPQLIAYFRLHPLDVTVLTTPLPPSERLESGVAVAHFLEVVRTKYNFNANDAEDLSFRKGDLLNVIVKHEEQWWKAQHQKDLNIGVIPSNYVEYVRDGPLAIEKKKVTAAAALRKQQDAAPPPPIPRRPSAASDAAAVAKKEAERKAIETRRREEEERQRQQEAEQEARRLAAEEALRRQQEEDDRLNREKEAERAKMKAAGAYKAPERPKFIVAKSKIARIANSFDKSALTFKHGDLIHVKRQNANGLWEGAVMDGKRRGKRGHFPFTFVDLVDSAAFDEDTKAAERAFCVIELKKQGVDVGKLVKAGVAPPPALPTRVPPPVVAVPVVVSVETSQYEAEADSTEGQGPPPPVPSRPARAPGLPQSAPPVALAAPSRRAQPPLPPASSGGGGDDDTVYGSGGGDDDDIYGPKPPGLGATVYGDGDDDDYYGPGQDADAIEDAEDDMIYGMQDDFDAAAVEAAMEDIYGTI